VSSEGVDILMALQQAWSKLLGTSNQDSAWTVTSGKDGSVYIAGTTEGNLDGKQNHGSFDGFVIKYDVSGAKEWTRLIGTGANEGIYSIVAAEDGSLYLAGFTGADALVTKYSGNGTEAWRRNLGSSSRWDAAWSSAISSSGEIYIAGNTEGSFDGQTNSGKNDGFLTKYDENGNKAWTRFISTPYEDHYTGKIATVSDGSIYLGGSTRGNLDGQSNSGGSDAYIAKFNNDGSRQWTRLIGTQSDDGGSIIKPLSDGSLIVMGNTRGNLDGQINHGGDDIFICKFQSDGTRLWTKLIGTSGDDHSVGLLSLGGKIYLAGNTKGSFTGQENQGDYDGFVLTLNDEYNLVEAKQFGTSNQDQLSGFTYDSDGNLYVSGHTSGNIDGQSNSGSFDAFLIKFTQGISSPAPLIPTYTITRSAATINEGAVLTSTVTTTNVASGTTLYYSLSGTGITTADFSAGALTGEGTTDATGKFTFTHTLANDLTTEGAESLSIKLYSDSARTLQVGSTASVSIADTSNKTPTYTITPSATTINEGSILTTSVATSNVKSGTILYYALSGDGINTDDFSLGGITGSARVNNIGGFSFAHTIKSDLKTEGAESLAIKLYSDSARTLQVGVTATVSIVDTSTTPIPTYTLTPSATTINEGARLTTTVTTTGVDRLSKLYYSLSGTGITAADFLIGNLTGEGTTDSWGKFNFSHILAKDLLTEGTESISIKLYSDSDRTLQVGSTATVLIEDTSVQIEFTGTINNDVLVGNSANNTIKGLEGADTLTGSEGADKFVYALADSRLAAYDHITDFAIGTDLIDAPIALSSANLRELGAVSALTQADIAAVLTTAIFVRNGAATFSFGTGSSTRTFLALNDFIAGYSSTADGLIEITGFTGALTNLALI